MITMQHSRVSYLLGVLLLSLGLLGGLVVANMLAHDPINHTVYVPPDPKTIVVAGDISCEATQSKTAFSCQSDETAKLITEINPDAVLTAGDNQYPKGSFSSFQDSYDKTWGAFKDKTYPTPGNHEYLTADAAGYFDYFGDRAGEKGKGYYSFVVGDWLLIALNSEIDVSAQSPQLAWLKQELAAHPNVCTLAYWHQPRFSTGSHASDAMFDPLWRLLYEHNADIIVNGHSHAYERFAPQNPDGQYDADRGIVQFVSGKGGYSSEALRSPIPTLVTRQNHAAGVLKLDLYPSSAQFEFMPVDSQQHFSDSGTITCH